MNKVLLINPPSDLIVYKEDRCQNEANDLVSRIIRPPISLMSLGGISEKLGLTTKIIDAPIEKVNLNHLKDYLKRWKPDWVVVNSSVDTLESDLLVLEIARANGAKTVAFGYASSLDEIEIMKKAEFLDFSIRGEPELTFQELIGESIPLEKIKGLTYREKNQVFQNKSRDFIQNLDELPFPAHTLIQNELYRVPTTGEIFTTIQTARGCPHRCTFCLSNLLNGTKVRKRSILSIIKEVKLVTKKYSIHNFFFRADTFTIDKRWVLDLCDAIIKSNLKITWFCNSRVDTVDLELLTAMKKAGCQLITFGIESGSERILKYIKKGITKNQVKNAVELARSLGILTGAIYIIGLPGDTINSIHETIQFSKEVNSDIVEFLTYIPMVGAEAMGQDLPDLKPSTIKKLISYALIQYYFRPKMLVRQFRNFYLEAKGITNLLNVILVSLRTVRRIFKK